MSSNAILRHQITSVLFKLEEQEAALLARWGRDEILRISTEDGAPILMPILTARAQCYAALASLKAAEAVK